MSDQEKEPLVASGGWCAPSDAIFAFEDATEPFDAIPEVQVLRGETWEQAGERMRAARAARRNAAIAAGIPEDALDGKQTPQAMSQRGHWEYAARGTDGEMSLPFPTALEAFEETLFATDDVVVRRWVEESDWEVVS